MHILRDLVEVTLICAAQARLTTSQEVARALWTMASEYHERAQDRASKLNTGRAPDIGDLPHVGRIIDRLANNRLPGLFQFRENVVAGGLMSYGASLPDLFRRAAGYVDKILRGTRPADLPVEQPTKFELVVNLKTAKALRLTIPEPFLLLADEVIE